VWSGTMEACGSVRRQGCYNWSEGRRGGGDGQSMPLLNKSTSPCIWAAVHITRAGCALPSPPTHRCSGPRPDQPPGCIRLAGAEAGPRLLLLPLLPSVLLGLAPLSCWCWCVG
jgi:hypothetical protein